MVKPNHQFVRMRDVVLMLDVSRSTIYRWIDEGKFPSPVNLSERTIAFRQKDLDEWAATRQSQTIR
ncbi:helix-turn-helix transcriptional regulator [Andreprevotia lacus]|uniref:helix-turn-helix transcriptional regulator n=1 Tax=Andreprevotia lacus TaxID=1121000 RepID=UPI003570AE96